MTTRHEQGAAFMADVHGRLTGKAAVAMATLGPGATNLITGVADAYLDRAPMVAITGQASSDKLHKEAHQVVDIVRMVEPVTKWNTRVERVEAIPEIVRKAFRVAVLEKPGPDPHRAAREPRRCAGAGRRSAPLEPGQTYFPEPTDEAIDHAAELIATSQRPLVLAGNGVLRRRAAPELRAFARGLHVPVAVTFMGKGAIDDRSHLSLMAVGLQARDHVLSGFDRADLVICVGYDLVEYAPAAGTRTAASGSSTSTPSPPRSTPSTGPRSSSSATSRARSAGSSPRSCPVGSAAATPGSATRPARPWSTPTCGRRSSRSSPEPAAATAAPSRSPRSGRSPTSARRSARTTSSSRDVGAHKVWVARLYQAYEPNTVIISNGFAAMGISVPGAIAAKLVHPDRKVVALCGDGGFLMNSQELETATADRGEHHRRRLARRRLRADRLEAAQRVRPPVRRRVRQPGLRRLRGVVRDPRLPADLGGRPAPDCLRRALDVDGPTLVEVPIDYRENLRLTEHLGALSGA